MAIPKPEPRDWQLANARELQVTDKEVLALLRASKRRVDAILAALPSGKQEVTRAQLEQTRARLLAEQADVFERLGDVVSARRARAASRSARLSAAADAALLSLVGRGAQGQYLYESALQVGQRAIDAALARMRFSQVPLSQRIYKTGVWMGGRLGKLINETLASGLNAQDFAKRARDWFNPNTPGGVRYAAMRLARTEINNAFHSMSAAKYADTPWINQVDWNLSKSHPKKDICNVVHEQSPYPADKVPARPHPQCMCYITPKPVDEDEFVDRFIAGEYDDYLDAELELNGWRSDKDDAQSNPFNEAGTTAESPVPEIRIRKAAKISSGDATDWAADLLRNGYAENELTNPGSFSDPRDLILAGIANHQNFNKFPEIGSVDAEIAAGGTELWRGVTPFNGNKNLSAKSAQEIAAGLRDGDYEPGTGIYGNGYYFSVARRVAEYYGKAGAVQRAAIRSNARIVEYDELKRIQREWIQKIQNNSPDLGELFSTLDFQTPAGQYPPSLVDSIGSDPGRLAALLGYDAIRITGKQDGAPFVKGEPSAKHLESGKKFSAHVQYIVLNRTALVLEAE